MGNNLAIWESRAARILSRWYIFALLVIAVSLLMYGLCLDDFPISESFAHMLPFSLGALIDQTWNGLWNFCRPTAMVIFRIGYALFETNYVGYRSMLLVLHIINVFLLLAFARVLFKDRLVAIASALIFATHPIHSECIALIVSLFDVSCLTFYLASLLAFNRHLVARVSNSKSQSRNWMILSCFFVVLCLGAKEVGATLPFVLMAFDGLRRTWRRGHIRASAVSVFKSTLPYLIILGIYVIFRLARYEQNVSYARLFFEDPFSVFGKLADYFRLVIFPNPMWLVLLAMLPLAKRQYIFALIFLFLPIIPPLQILPQERFVYVPSAGYSLAVGWCFVVGWRRLLSKIGNLIQNRNLASVGTAAVLLLAIGQIPFAYMNTMTWSNSIPIRKALKSIWEVVGRPAKGTILYFSNIDPQYNLAQIGEYDSTLVGQFRAEKIINYPFEEHKTPEFFFRMNGFDARADRRLATKCRQLEIRIGPQDYGQDGLSWGIEDDCLCKWLIYRTDPESGEILAAFRPEADNTINLRLDEERGTVLTSPVLNMPTTRISTVTFLIDRSRLSNGISCQLEWTFSAEGEGIRGGRSEILPKEGGNSPQVQLTSPRFNEDEGSAPLDPVAFDPISLDLGSLPEWVFDERQVYRISLWLYGTDDVRISAIRFEPPSRTMLFGLKPMVQFHEEDRPQPVQPSVLQPDEGNQQPQALD
ncbi:MAG: hypothetical protein JW941_04320 [Candidatus Coatesbacteria bacterium]|nr:hypothetical protein [Candidatus Coatesbacteria bacterium]